MEINIISAFCLKDLIKSGNKAGVVSGVKLSAGEKQRIANYVNLPETVFIEESKKADFSFSYFTSVSEVDLCGHATIAALAFLSNQIKLLTPHLKIETKAGILSVFKEDDLFYMEQQIPKFTEIIPPDMIAESLNIPISDLGLPLPVQIVSTGLPDIIIPIKNKEILDRINPDFEKISDISKKYSCVGYHLFCPADNKYSAYTRNFAPLYAINEESATGTASCALAAYLYKYTDKNKEYKFRQGDSLMSPSEIQVKTESDHKSQIEKIFVGGRAEFISRMKIKSKDFY